MVSINTRNKKQIAMVMLATMGLTGISVTRDFLLQLFQIDVFGIVDVGTIIGIFAIVAFWWMWRREL